MAPTSRRDLLPALAATSLLPLFASLAAAAQTPPSAAAVPAPGPQPSQSGPDAPSPGTLAPDGHLLVNPALCHIFPFATLPLHPTSFGASRPVFSATLPTGEHIELHETTLNPGQMPHPPHHHRNSELLLVREGTLDFFFAEAPGGPLLAHRLSAGGVAFNGSDQEHAMKNVGSVPANYFVVEISQHDPGPA